MIHMHNCARFQSHMNHVSVSPTDGNWIWDIGYEIWDMGYSYGIEI